MATAMRTALVDRIGDWALSRRIAGRLTGDHEDLRQLNTRAEHELLRNLIYDWAAVGARRRNELAAADMIADASSRWYREKPEYKNLFRFKPRSTEPQA